MSKFDTIKDAALHWVNCFNQFPQDMLEMLVKADPDSWSEVTLPAVGDRCYVYDLPDTYEGSCDEGEIETADYDNEVFAVCLDDGTVIEVDIDGLEVERDGFFPMWGYLWQFDDMCDTSWVENGNGVAALSACGFRVYLHEEWGYFFGIDGCGYDFYDSHWIPLYKKRGLKWHKLPA